MSVIDAHLHVFRRYSEDYPRPIHAGLAEADREVLAEDLIKEMIIEGVDNEGINETYIEFLNLI